MKRRIIIVLAVTMLTRNHIVRSLRDIGIPRYYGNVFRVKRRCTICGGVDGGESFGGPAACSNDGIESIKGGGVIIVDIDGGDQGAYEEDDEGRRQDSHRTLERNMMRTLSGE